jgi:hypothetical protein
VNYKLLASVCNKNCFPERCLGMTYYWFPEAPGPGVRGEKDGEVGE